MTEVVELLGAVALVNVFGGALLALLVLKGQESIPRFAPVPGILFGGIAIWAQMTVGDQLGLTIPVFKTLVLAAVVSALTGLVGVFSTLQAEDIAR
jgi:hypothetical protein